MRRVSALVLWLLVTVSLLLIAVQPILLLGFVVVGLGDEQVGNHPAHALILAFVPCMCLVSIWSLFALAVRRKWLIFNPTDD